MPRHPPAAVSADATPLAIARALYGPHVHALTADVAKAAIGKVTYGISGQSWQGSDDPVKELERIRILGFTTDHLDGTGRHTVSLRSTFQEYDDIALHFERIGGPFGASEQSDGTFGTGSGGDDVFLFVVVDMTKKKEVAAAAPSQAAAVHKAEAAVAKAEVAVGKAKQAAKVASDKVSAAESELSRLQKVLAGFKHGAGASGGGSTRKRSRFSRSHSRVRS